MGKDREGILNSTDLALAKSFGLPIRDVIKAKDYGLSVADYVSLATHENDLPEDVELGSWRSLQKGEALPPRNHYLQTDRGIVVPARLYPPGSLYPNENGNQTTSVIPSEVIGFEQLNPLTPEAEASILNAVDHNQ